MYGGPTFPDPPNLLLEEDRIENRNTVRGAVTGRIEEHGDPPAITPAAEDIPVTVELLVDPDDRQFKTLENGFLQEIGEPPATEEKQERLARVIRDEKIAFFVAKCGQRAVGMCSVAKCFSTFACTCIGVFDDFYIEPAFRKKASPGCWHRPRKNGARKTILPA